jgi:hypothetical protein
MCKFNDAPNVCEQPLSQSSPLSEDDALWTACVAVLNRHAKVESIEQIMGGRQVTQWRWIGLTAHKNVFVD